MRACRGAAGGYAPPRWTLKADLRAARATAGSGCTPATAVSTEAALGCPDCRARLNSRTGSPADAPSTCPTSNSVSPWSSTAAAVSTQSQAASSAPSTSAGETPLVQLLGQPEQRVRAQHGLLDGLADGRLGRPAGHPERLEGQAAHQRVLAAGGVHQLGDGAVGRAGGHPGAVLGAGGARRVVGAGAEQLGGALLDVPGGGLRHRADLLQLGADRPVPQRGELGGLVTAGQRPDGGQAVQHPVQDGGDVAGGRQGVDLRLAAGAADGRDGGGGVRDGRERPGTDGHADPALVEAAPQQLQQLAVGDRPVHQVQEGEQLGRLVDGLPGEHREDAAHGGGRYGCEQGPGVEQRRPAADHGLVVVLPGVQPPAGARTAVPELDQTDLQRLAPGLGGGRDGHGEGEPGRPRVVGQQLPALVDLAQLAGPAGDPDRVGEHAPGERGQFGGGGEAVGYGYPATPGLGLGVRRRAAAGLP